MKATIRSIAHYTPEKMVPNSFFTLVPYPDYILIKTGIEERRYFEGATSDMIVPAIQSCLQDKKIGINDVDCLIVATVTPDYQFPSTSAVVLHKLQATKPWGFDLAAACAGFIYGIQLGSKLIESGAAKRVLVCGADKMSSTVNFDDIKTSILFGDGCGVVLLEPSSDENFGIQDVLCKMNATEMLNVYTPAGGTALPLTYERLINSNDKMVMQGRNVFELGVSEMASVAKEILARNNLTIGDVDYVVPHQSNLRMIEDLANRIGIQMDKVLVNIEKRGNTASATIPSCLAEYYKMGKIKRGDKILVTAIGAGFAYGAAIINWDC